MTYLLTLVTTPAWAYLALFGFLAVDAVMPVVPIQAIMITSGALTVYGTLNLPLVIAAGAAGMLTGDLLCFVLGRTAGHGSGPGLGGRLAALRHRFGPRHDDDAPASAQGAKIPADRHGAGGHGGSGHGGGARRAAARFTRGLRRTGPLVLLLCRFVPGGRMAACYQAGRTGYPIRLFLAYDGAAAAGWATYGGLVGHVGGTAVTQSAWRLFAVAATAAVIFGTAGWVLALFGGRPGAGDDRHAPHHDDTGPDTGSDPPDLADVDRTIADRAASTDAPPRRSTPTATDR